MEPNQPGNKKMPDFKGLDARVIAEPTHSPSLVIQTNLDPKSVKEDNPYYRNEEKTDDKKFQEYFEGK